MKINSKDLFNYINNLKPTDKIKFKVYYDDCYVTDILWDGENFNWESGRFTSGAFFNSLYDFEIIEEEKEIEKIRMNGDCFFSESINAWINKEKSSAYCEFLSNKINELVDEINKLKKEIEKENR